MSADADIEYQNDRDMVIAAMRDGRKILGMVRDAMRDDKEIALMAISLRWEDIKYLSERLKRDHDVVMAAVTENPLAIKYAPDEYRSDPELMLSLVKQHGGAIKYFIGPTTGPLYEEIVLEAARTYKYTHKFILPESFANKSFAIRAVRADGRLLEKFKEEIRHDKEVVLEAVKQNGTSIKYTSDSLRSDFDVAMAAVRQTWAAIDLIPKELRNDKGLALESVMSINRSNADNHLFQTREERRYSIRKTFLAGYDRFEKEISKDRFLRNTDKIEPYLDDLKSKLAYVSSGPISEPDSIFYNLSMMWGHATGYSIFDLLVEPIPSYCL